VPLCEKILAGWTASEPYERLAEKAASKPGGSEEINTPDKQNAVYFSAMSLPVKDTHPDYPALVLGDYILGSSSLSSRLGDRVRQQEGLSYGVGSGFNASSLDPRAAFYLYAISNPDNIPKVKQVIAEELEKIRKEGVTADELDKAKVGYLQKQTVTRSNDSELARLLAQNIHADRTMEYYAKLENGIRSVTAEDVQEALKEHIDPDKLFTVVAGD